MADDSRLSIKSEENRKRMAELKVKKEELIRRKGARPSTMAEPAQRPRLDLGSRSFMNSMSSILTESTDTSSPTTRRSELPPVLLTNRPPSLSKTDILNSTVIPPKPPTITYERQIQVEIFEDQGEDEDALPSVEPMNEKQRIFRRVNHLTSKENPELKLKEEIQDNPEEVAERIMSSNDFGEFFHKSSRIVERALGQEFDIDLTPKFVINKEDNSHQIKKKCEFYDKNFAERVVCALEWSPEYEELLLASYQKVHTDYVQENTGVVLLWSLSLKTRPEFSLFAQSTVTSCSFNSFDHNLVLGGCYSGQIVIWDLRAKSQPVIKTPSMAESHSQPISSISIVGSQNANNLVSLSTDGKICLWSLSSMQSPSSTFGNKHLRIKS